LKPRKRKSPSTKKTIKLRHLPKEDDHHHKLKKSMPLLSTVKRIVNPTNRNKLNSTRLQDTLASLPKKKMQTKLKIKQKRLMISTPKRNPKRISGILTKNTTIKKSRLRKIMPKTIVKKHKMPISIK
jgi:hypothetical protein